MSFFQFANVGFCDLNYFHHAYITADKSYIKIVIDDREYCIPEHADLRWNNYKELQSSLLAALGEKAITFLNGTLIISKTVLDNQIVVRPLISYSDVNKIGTAVFISKANRKNGISVHIGEGNWQRFLSEFAVCTTDDVPQLVTQLLTLQKKSGKSYTIWSDNSNSYGEVRGCLFTDLIKVVVNDKWTCYFDHDFLHNLERIVITDEMLSFKTGSDTVWEMRADVSEQFRNDFLLAMFDHGFVYGRRKEDIAIWYYSKLNNRLRVYSIDCADGKRILSPAEAIFCTPEYAQAWMSRLGADSAEEFPCFMNASVLRSCSPCPLQIIDTKITIANCEIEVDNTSHASTLMYKYITIMQKDNLRE